MIDALFNQPDYVAAKKMLDATVLRQEAIASNLSNLETPNYKRLDIAPSFESQLSQAVNSGNAAQISSSNPASPWTSRPSPAAATATQSPSNPRC